MTRWEDLEEWERLAAKLADAGPTDEDARAWVQKVMDAARADERERIGTDWRLDRQLARTEALKKERDRLRAKVEALPPEMVYSHRGQETLLYRADVLALFDGGSDE